MSPDAGSLVSDSSGMDAEEEEEDACGEVAQFDEVAPGLRVATVAVAGGGDWG